MVMCVMQIKINGAEPATVEPSAEAWAAGYKRYRYAQDMEYDIDWQIVQECARLVIAFVPSPDPPAPETLKEET